jgi:hypothetical protein
MQMKKLLIVFSMIFCLQEYNWAKDFKIGLIDLMLLNRQKLGALLLAKQLGADGIEVDMGGLGNRESFDNQLLNDSVRNLFIQKSKELDLPIIALSMSGY